MKIEKRDWIFIAVIVAVLGTLFMSRGKQKVKNVPYDEKHGQFYEVMHMGRDRMELEKACLACHNAQLNPLSKAHPPKEQCLLCHKLVQPTN
jgi:hypothetical protein